TLADGSRVESAAMRIVGQPTHERIAAIPTASRFAERITGRRLTMTLEDSAHRLQAVWRAELRDGSRYVRQEVTLRALGAPLAVREIALVDLTAPGAPVTGTVKGSPVTIGSWFLGFEH